MLNHRLLNVLFTLGTLASNAAAMLPPKPLPPRMPFNYTAGVAQMGNSTFDAQLIDHSNPSLGTFSQFYYYSDEYYACPGSPIILFTPGEAAAAGYEGYLTNRTLIGVFAQAIGAAVIVIEHRYWGQSSPFAELTTENLQYLTLQNSIADLTYFGKCSLIIITPKFSQFRSLFVFMLCCRYLISLSCWEREA